jgi:predicted cobalt transporter CbtA
MIRSLVLRGLLLGLLAGLLAAGFGFVAGEPRIDDAIAIEEQKAAAAPAAAHVHEEAPPVSRDGQRAGLFLALGVYGTAVGGMFALLYAFVRGRVGPRSDPALAVGLAATCYVSVYMVPLLKYPANPPAVGDPGTIGKRTALYFVLVAISLLSVLAATRVARMLRAREPWAGPLAAVGTFIGLVALAFVVLPGVQEVPKDFPADLLWDFRVVSAGTQLVLWTGLGALFGIVTARATARAAT